MIIKRVLQTPWWALAGLWCSQVQPSFLLWQHRCKNICQCLHFQTIFAFAGIWSLFFLGLGKGKNRMQAFRVHIADQQFCSTKTEPWNVAKFCSYLLLYFQSRGMWTLSPGGALLFALSFLSAFCLLSVSCVSLSLCALCVLCDFTSNKKRVCRLLKKY